MARKRIKAGARQRDVAAVAGVSTATVSAVVNGRASQYGICRATEEKVQAVIRQMGYAPSLSALDMVAGRNSLVGLAITADYPGSDRLIAAMEPALAQAGFRLLVACLPADPVAAVARISNLARYDIGGLAIFPARALPLPGIGCPVVMVGRAGVGLPADCSPSAVNQLGQATARWLQIASQGMPLGELLLEPVPVVTPTNLLPQEPSPPLRPPP
jgi:DNA-binding LacI/PurR family transcriptional regulator